MDIVVGNGLEWQMMLSMLHVDDGNGNGSADKRRNGDGTLQVSWHVASGIDCFDQTWWNESVEVRGDRIATASSWTKVVGIHEL